MRATKLSSFKELTTEQRDEAVQLLKTDSLVKLEPEEYYVMKGYHLISMFNTIAQMNLELEDLRNEMEDR